MAEARRVVLITGASSGIGAALARVWAERGAAVALAARRRERLDALVVEIVAAGGQAIAVECDVTREGDNERAVARAVEAWGPARHRRRQRGLRRARNVRGPEARGLPAAARDERLRPDAHGDGFVAGAPARAGRLALVGSVAGYVSSPGTSAYAMSKYAVRALAEALRHELRIDGITVTHVAPGLVESEFRLKDDRGQLKPAAAPGSGAGLVDPADRRRGAADRPGGRGAPARGRHHRAREAARLDVADRASPDRAADGWCAVDLAPRAAGAPPRRRGGVGRSSARRRP